jgi:hypothetical protein
MMVQEKAKKGQAKSQEYVTGDAFSDPARSVAFRTPDMHYRHGVDRSTPALENGRPAPENGASPLEELGG